MALEQVSLVVGEEQSFVLNYNDIDYSIDLRFSDYGDNWFIDIYNGLNDDGTKNYVLTGQSLIVNVNVFQRKLHLGFGGLALIDTNPDDEVSLDAKKDIGSRLQLFRNI